MKRPRDRLNRDLGTGQILTFRIQSLVDACETLLRGVYESRSEEFIAKEDLSLAVAYARMALKPLGDEPDSRPPET